MEIDIIAVIISFFALGMSAYIGLKQVKINQKQADFQDKVELYLLNESITIRSADGSKPDEVFPGIFIRNVGNSVVYLERYIFDGKEYPLHKEVLPPVSAYNAFHYIFLPTDGTPHISISVDFYDWKNQLWRTNGYADFRNGIWEITYSPCEKQKQ